MHASAIRRVIRCSLVHGSEVSTAYFRPGEFATEILGGLLDGERWQWKSLAAAEAGHEGAVLLCRSAQVSCLGNTTCLTARP